MIHGELQELQKQCLAPNIEPQRIYSLGFFAESDVSGVHDTTEYD